jgi:hypothetical protein
MLQMLKSLPIGIQTYSELINNGFLYIDKTEYIYKMIKKKGYYFLSRPRRFGKSLLISTLEAIFLGKKELFKGLWIEKKEYDWQKHPVIRLDFTQIYNQEPEEFKNGLKRRLLEIAEDYNINIDVNIPESEVFKDLIKGLCKKTQQNVAILIDEYDKPIIDNINKIEIAKKNRDILKSFYGIMKGADEYIRFVILTGVTKFSRVSIFSDLNNLHDITTSPDYACMLGCTKKEIVEYFSEYIKLLADKENDNEKRIKDKIEYWYNGYRFSDSKMKVYNLFSLLLLFKELNFKNYWFETGTPTFLINLIKEENYDLNNLEYEEVNELAFSNYEIEHLDVMPLLFQTGYLTIKDYDKKNNLYKLYYPNYEVKQSFLRYLAASYSNIKTWHIDSYLLKIIKYLKENNLEKFFQTLHIFFSNINYELHIKSEKYYQTIFYVIFKLIGLQVEAEVSTNIGRIDVVIELEDKLYIFEFKINDTPENALKQIKDNKYYEKYLSLNKDIFCVGASFSLDNRNIMNWISKPADLG